MFTVHAWFWPGVALWVILSMGGWLTPPSPLAHTVSAPLGYEPPTAGTYTLPVIKPATDGDVLDTAGAPRRLFEYMDGKIVLLSFIYTRCSDARGCPLATGVFYTLADALAHDATLAPHVRLLTLSFDPAHDTPAVMRRYGNTAANGSANLWYRLTTASHQALQPILDGYGQYVTPELAAPGNFTATYSHLLKVFLIDRQRRVRNIYSVDFLHPQVLLNDIKTLLMANGTLSALPSEHPAMTPDQ
jgi:cytochrome c peroxidase